LDNKSETGRRRRRRRRRRRFVVPRPLVAPGKNTLEKKLLQKTHDLRF
jgi:hypothetical protein